MDGPVPRVGERASRPLRRDADAGGRHLERWKAHWLRQEQADSEEQMCYKAMLQRDAEAPQLEEEEEERAWLAAMPPPQQTPEEAALAAYQAAFGWAGHAPVFIDLTGDGDDGVDAIGKGKADNV